MIVYKDIQDMISGLISAAAKNDGATLIKDFDDVVGLLTELSKNENFDRETRYRLLSAADKIRIFRVQ